MRRLPYILSTFLVIASAWSADGILEGYLTDNATGASVPGATVTLDPDEPEAENIVVTSGPFGFFQVNDIPPGDYSLDVTHDHYDPHSEDITIAADDLLTRSIKLTNPTGESFFDIHVNVNGSQTGANLPNATVKVERWIGQDFLNAADQTINLTTDHSGLATAFNVQPGYIRVTVTKPGWNGGGPLIMPEGDPQFTAFTSVFQAHLQPVLTDISVLISGFNPFTEATLGPLAGVNIELTGLDFVQRVPPIGPSQDIEILPAETRLTPFAQGASPEDGIGSTVTFENVPPIRYRLVARKLGYLEDVQAPTDKYYREIIIEPDGTGKFQPMPIQISPIRIAETKIEIILDSPYSITEPIEGTTVKITGIDGTTSEHISREIDAELDAEAGKVKAVFENILPGTYGVAISQTGKTVAVQKPDNMPPFFGEEVDIDFYPISAQLEVSLDECLTETFELAPVPAEIHGILRATDTLSDPTFGASHDVRIFERRSGRVEFHIKDGIDFFKVPQEPTVVEAGEDGRFTVRLLPGFYGIKVPELTQYYGHDITIRDRTETNPSRFLFEQGWPYKQVWPQGYDYEYGHHWSFVQFSSNQNLEVSMQLQRHYMNLVNRIEEEGPDPCDSVVLARTPDGTNITAPFEDLETYGQMHLTGGDGARHTINLDSDIEANFFRFYELEPGNYTITGTHPRFSINSVDFTVNGWTTTGELPPISPTDLDPSYFFPGLSHDVSSGFYRSNEHYAMLATYPDVGNIQWEVFRFDGQDGDYDQIGSSHLNAYFSPNWTELVFRSNLGPAPAGGEYQVWYDLGDEGWFTATATGGALFQVLIGGPQNNTNTEGSVPPFIGGSIDVIVHAVNVTDPRQEIADIHVTLANSELVIPDGVNDPAGIIVTTGDPNSPATGTTQGALQVQTAADSAGKWSLSGYSTELVTLPDTTQSTNTTYKIVVTVERQLTVSGTVKGRPYHDDGHLDGEELEGVRVDILDRYHGNILATTKTEVDGTFNVGNLDRQVVFIKLSKNGYIPFRKRFAIADNVDDLVLGENDLTIDALTPPKAGTGFFTMDRFGLFVPGVLKSGDATLFDVDNARGALNLTWQAGGDHPDTTQYTLDSFDSLSGAVQPGNDITITDKIDRIIVVDQRWFAEPFKNKPDTNENPIFLTSETPPKDEIDKLLDDIAKRDSDGLPFFVISKEGQKKTFGEGETAPDTDVTFSGILEIEDLPPGLFDPMVLIITEGGATRVVTYELPDGKKPLQGIRLAPWAAGMLEFIGVQATTNIINKLTTNDPRGFNPKGRLNFGGSFESGIDEDDDGYLIYEYGLKVILCCGVIGTIRGPLYMWSGVVGLSLSIKGTFKVHGRKEEVSLNLSGAVGKKFEKDDLDEYVPGIIGNAGFVVEEVTMSASHKGSIVQVLSQEDINNRMVPDLILRSKTSAFVAAEISKDISDLVAAIPAIKVISVVLNKFGVAEFYFTVDVGVGGGIERQITTVFPRPMEIGGSVTELPETHFTDGLGNGIDEAKGLIPTVSAIDVQILAGGALKIKAFAETVEGKVGLQLGPPKDIVGQKGLKLNFNTEPTWPPVKSVLGALSVVGSVEVKAGPFSLGRSFQHDLNRIEWHAKPVAEAGRSGPPVVPTYFEIYSLNIADVKLFPSDGTPTTLTNEDDNNVIDGLFDHEQYDVIGGTSPIMLYSSLNEQTGLLDLIFATQQPDGSWLAGTPIASAPYFSGMAIAEDPAGGRLAVWMEVDQADIENPFAPTTIKFSTQATEGDPWSAPQTLSALASLGLQPKISRIDEKLLLTFKMRPGGPFSVWHKVYSATWDGSIDQWGDVPQLVTPEMIDLVDCAAVGSNGPSADQLAVLVTLDTAGIIRSYVYSDSGWTETAQAAADGARRLSISKGPAGNSYLAYDVVDGGGISVLRLDNARAAGWTPIIESPLDTGSVHDLSVAVFDDNAVTRALVIWSVGAADGKLFHAIIDGDGTISKEPIEATADVGGVMIRLRLMPDAAGIGGTIFAGTSTDSSIAVRTFSITDATTVIEGPVIVSEPQNTASFAGSSVSFSISATSQGAPTYQWYHDHVEIDGATSRTLTIDTPTAVDAGFYTVLITDNTGQTMSELAELTFSDDYLFGLAAGWNMIGFPVAVTKTFDELLVDSDGESLGDGAIWAWNAKKRRFVFVPPHSVPQPGFGYLVHSSTGGTTASFVGETPPGLPEMFGGWNLITPQTVGDLKSVFRLRGRVYDMHDSRIRIANRNDLKLLRGYWIFGQPIEP